MDTLDYIIKKYNIDPSGKLPIEIPNVGKDNLAELLAELNFKIGVEVGVAEGKYSSKLCEANPQMKVYGVDAWKVYGNYDAIYSSQTLDRLYNKAKKLPDLFPNYEIIKEFSMDAIKKFEDSSLDFVYIDANHQEPYITQDITEWSKKVRPGGIVSGHDYFRGYKGGSKFEVIEAVNKYTGNNNIKLWFVLGLSDKIPGLLRDPSRSWFWIKK